MPGRARIPECSGTRGTAPAPVVYDPRNNNRAAAPRPCPKPTWDKNRQQHPRTAHKHLPPGPTRLGHRTRTTHAPHTDANSVALPVWGTTHAPRTNAPGAWVLSAFCPPPLPAAWPSGARRARRALATARRGRRPHGRDKNARPAQRAAHTCPYNCAHVTRARTHARTVLAHVLAQAPCVFVVHPPRLGSPARHAGTTLYKQRQRACTFVLALSR